MPWDDFFLEAVQDVDRVPELDGVDGPIGVALMVFHDLEDTGVAESP